MPMQTPRDLFLYQLSYMYDVEQHNLRIMPELSAGAADDRARQVIEQHLAETQQQVQLLDRCFNSLGISPHQLTAQVAEGMQRDHQAFMAEQPAPAVLTMHNVAAAAKIEHMEVAAYRGLLLKAQQLGMPEIVEALQTILAQEEGAVQLLEAVAAQLDDEMAPAMQRVA